MKKPVCDYCTWDSHFFNCHIARVTGDVLDQNNIAAALAWCRKRSIDCLYYLADPSDAAVLRLAESNGFALVDIRMVLEVPKIVRPYADTLHTAVKIRTSLASDSRPLENLARRNHTNTRFYNDAHFSRSKCADLYETWITKCCGEFNDTVFVADYGHAITGYIACRMQKNGTGAIVLAGVHKNARNKGVGTALVCKALEWFHDQGAVSASVVTQGTNIKALRLYTSWGFLPKETKLWYHRWFD